MSPNCYLLYLNGATKYLCSQLNIDHSSNVEGDFVLISGSQTVDDLTFTTSVGQMSPY